MPAMTREAMLQHIGLATFNSYTPNQQTSVQRAFERLYGDLEGLGVTASPAALPAPAPAPTPRQQQASPTPTPAPSRSNLTQRLTEALTSGAAAGMTVRQIAGRLNIQPSTVERIVTQQVTTGAYLKEGNKYRISTTAAAPAPSPRRRAASGETATDRVANLVQQRPGITKAEVISAMTPDRPNHVGIWLARLCKNNRITGTKGGQDGPYYPTATTTQRQAAAA